MSLEEFIITVFCWVEDGLESVIGGVKLRTRGFAPRLSDSEVITLEIVGELLGHDGDEAIWSYFKRHWVAWFPGLGDRSTFVRQAAKLWRIKQLLHERLVGDVGARAAAGPIIDGFPIAVCKLARAVRSQVLKAEADYGYCAAKREYYYGLKAHLLIDLRGVAVGVTITPRQRRRAGRGLRRAGGHRGAGLGRQGLYPPAVQGGWRSAGHRPTNAGASEHEGRPAPLVAQAVAARSQADRNRHQPTRATLQPGENPGARRLAFDPSSHAQALGSYRRRLAQPPSRSRASRLGRPAGRLTG